MNRYDDDMKRAVAEVNRGGSKASPMSRVAQDLFERAMTTPRPGLINGAIDLWQARRSSDNARIVAGQAEDVRRVGRVAQDLVVMGKETEVRIAHLDLELDQVANAQAAIALSTEHYEQERIIQRLVFGDRARAAMAAARTRAIEGETRLAIAQGYLGEVQRRAQLGPADIGELSPDGNDDFADVIDHPHARRRR